MLRHFLKKSFCASATVQRCGGLASGGKAHFNIRPLPAEAVGSTQFVCSWVCSWVIFNAVPEDSNLMQSLRQSAQVLPISSISTRVLQSWWLVARPQKLYFWWYSGFPLPFMSCYVHLVIKEHRVNLVRSNSREDIQANSPNLIFHHPSAKGVPKFSIKQKASKQRGLIHDSS